MCAGAAAGKPRRSSHSSARDVTTTWSGSRAEATCPRWTTCQMACVATTLTGAVCTSFPLSPSSGTSLLSGMVTSAWYGVCVRHLQGSSWLTSPALGPRLSESRVGACSGHPERCNPFSLQHTSHHASCRARACEPLWWVHLPDGISQDASPRWHLSGCISQDASSRWHLSGCIFQMASPRVHLPDGISQDASSRWHLPGCISQDASSRWHLLGPRVHSALPQGPNRI